MGTIVTALVSLAWQAAGAIAAVIESGAGVGGAVGAGASGIGDGAGGCGAVGT